MHTKSSGRSPQVSEQTPALSSSITWLVLYPFECQFSWLQHRDGLNGNLGIQSQVNICCFPKYCARRERYSHEQNRHKGTILVVMRHTDCREARRGWNNRPSTERLPLKTFPNSQRHAFTQVSTVHFQYASIFPQKLGLPPARANKHPLYHHTTWSRFYSPVCLLCCGPSFHHGVCVLVHRFYSWWVTPIMVGKRCVTKERPGTWW